MSRPTLALLATLIAATINGHLCANAIAAERGLHGLDPAVVRVLSNLESRRLGLSPAVVTGKQLAPRSPLKKVRPTHKPGTRLKVKFRDDLQVRVDQGGLLTSRSGRSVSAVQQIIDELGVTLRPTVTTPEADVDVLLARASAQSGRAQPDIKGLYWLDGPAGAVALAAEYLWQLPEAEWIDWVGVYSPERSHGQLADAALPPRAVTRSGQVRPAAAWVKEFRGACMLSRDACVADQTRSECDDLGGTFLGPGSPCAGGTRSGSGGSRGGIEDTGACCVPSSNASFPCIDGVNEDFCENALGGVFLGIDSACGGGNTLCGLAGACCLGGTCTTDDETESLCTDVIGGEFQGEGTTCGGTDCLNTGTCCTLGTCVDNTSELNCINVLNGIFFGFEDTCEDIEDECPIGGGADSDQFGICVDDCDELIAWFSGWCCVDQHLQYDDITTFGLSSTPGCVDTSFAHPLGGSCDELTPCCGSIVEVISSCDPLTGNIWGAECASLAQLGGPDAECECAASATSIGPCGAPFGGMHRPQLVQPIVVVDPDTCLISDDQTICSETVPTFVTTGNTPDYFAMGLQPWMTNEPINEADWNIAAPNDLVALLPWPMGGSVIGDSNGSGVGYTIEDYTGPQLGTISDVEYLNVPGLGLAPGGLWAGEGLDLYPDNRDPGGITAALEYTGLYGLGDFWEDLTARPNGAYGSGVKVGVLGWSAYVQQYTTQDGSGNVFTWGGVHEELTDIGLEGRETTHPELQLLFDPSIQPAQWEFSADHGTGVLGILAGAWDPEDPSATSTTTGIRGIAPQAEYIFFPLVDLETLDSGGREDTAWTNAISELDVGDVLVAAYRSAGQGDRSKQYQADTFVFMRLATDLGISVVTGAGNGGADATEFEFPGEEGQNSGAIVAGAVTPGEPYKRWVTGNQGSNFYTGAQSEDTVARLTTATWGTGITTCGLGPNRDNWLGFKTVTYTSNCDINEIAARSYTNNFRGMGAAAAILAGCTISLQGIAQQVFQSPVSPEFARVLLAGGAITGVIPDTGQPIIEFPGADSFRTENNMTNGNDDTDALWDWIDAADGGGNITGELLDPRRSCDRLIVSSIYDTPHITNMLIIRGELLSGDEHAIASIDGYTLGVLSEWTPRGWYTVPDGVPGNRVFYGANGNITDIYLTGVIRGGLFDTNSINVSVTVLPTQADITFMVIHLCNFDLGRWDFGGIGVLAQGDTDLDVEVNFASRYFDTDGTYHMRVITTSSLPGPNYYDQIRILANPMPGQPHLP